MELRKNGEVHDRHQLEAAVALAKGAPDVLVVVHGWLSDKTQARTRTRELTANIKAVAAERTRGLVVVNLLWPSTQWVSEADLAGGGASTEAAARELREHIKEDVDDEDVRTDLLEQAGKLEEAEARVAFVDALRGLVPGDDDDDSCLFEASFGRDQDELFQRAAAFRPNRLRGTPRGGGAANDPSGVPGPWPGRSGPSTGEGAAMGVAGLRRPFAEGALHLLNLTTYYRMRERTTHIGRVGAAEVLRRLGTPNGRRLHLVGHSMGARVISVTVTEARSPQVSSMVLLQGAFSHFGFAETYDGSKRSGLFRPVLTGDRLIGPLLVTHTRNDSAVKWPYLLASTLAQQVAAGGVLGTGGRYGAIGSNGARGTPESHDGELRSVGHPYRFLPRMAHNLRSDGYITSHSDVSGPEVADAIAAAAFGPPHGGHH
ncbi:hypothetical protein ABTX81_28540 [Kitasatospora sp. NPDC097605]|uniref:hypothetical protein n=1 Tax=Kitasatospora sp. NPDC097605 TaxID=3157226 RepID=UPI00333282D8